jgi:hypothetical protein
VLVETHAQEGSHAVGASQVVGAGGELLRCVWSGHPDYTRDCRACIPSATVVSAWRREREDYGTAEGFFFFAWNERVWLAYGLRDGRVRGVYCPQHSTARTVSLLRLAQPERLIL